jgi:uncharacterized membrane protein (DUF485 family)
MPRQSNTTGPERRDDSTSRRNARYGLVLFVVYLIIYSAFVLLNAFAAEWMKLTVLGINLAVLYGLGLIVAAFVLALVYAWLCRSPVAPASREEAR